jgi:hypothetical protein
VIGALVSERTSERGVVLVWLAMMMTVLLGVGALGIDVAHLQQVKADAQKAADAAALAGAVYLPENEIDGRNQAQAIAAKNGFTDVTATADPSRPSQMNVTVRKNVDNFLAGVLGIDDSDVSASASAEYLKPVAMGSPANQYGNNPESSGAPGSSTYPNLWGNVTGDDTGKIQGNAYTSNSCSGGQTDNCSGTNSDFDPQGYYYTVHFNGPGTVNLEIFDPGFVAVGNHCGANAYNNDLQGAAGIPQANVVGWPAGATPGPSTRYRHMTNSNLPPTTANPGNRYCTGDMPFETSGSGSAVNMPTTTYRVLGPAKLAGSPSGAATACQQWSFPGFGGNIPQRLTNPSAGARINVSPQPQWLGSYFRQWWQIPGCSITGNAGDEYFIQVNGAGGSGNNNFALRATGSGAGNVSIHGNEKMAIFANAAANVNAEFYLARILPNAAGKTLVLNFFDIGDAGSGVTGTLTVRPPSGPGESGGSFSGCEYTRPPGSATGPPFGTFQATSAGCSITGVSSSLYQGQWVQLRIPIPEDYTCNFDNAQGCWLRINYLFNGTVNDVTSWSAVLEGDPVRLTR